MQTISTFGSTANVLTQAVFDPYGQNVYVASPSQHKIYFFSNQATTSPLTQPTGSTYTGTSTFNPDSLAVGASGDLYVATSNAAAKRLYRFAGTYPNGSTITQLATLPAVPNDLKVNAGETRAFVSLTSSTNNLASVDLTSNAISFSTTTASSNVLALTDDAGTLVVGDGAPSATDFLTMATGTSGRRNVSVADGSVVAIATPVSSFIHYNTYAIDTSSVVVVDSSTGGLVEGLSSGGGDIVAVVPSPDGKYVYVVSQGLTGSGGPVITMNATARFGTGLDPALASFTVASGALAHRPVLTSAVLSPSGDTMVLGDSANSAVESFDVSTSQSPTYGTVTQVALLNGATAMTPLSMSLTADGSFVYVADVAASGTLRGITSLRRSTYGAFYNSPVFQPASSLHDNPPSGSSVSLTKPLQVIASPTGQSVVVLDGNPSQPLLFQFPIQTSGQLASDPDPALMAGTNPIALSLSPTAAVAYVTDATTWQTSGINLSDPLKPFTVFSTTASTQPTSNAVTPDGQFVCVGVSGAYFQPAALMMLLASSGALLQTTVGAAAAGLAVSPTSSSLTLSSTLTYPGQIGWTELQNGGSNPSIRAASTVVAFHGDGTPKDAVGVRAGTSTALRSYAFSLQSLSLPTVGLPIDLSAFYDSARIMNGLDTTTNQPDLAMGWRLSVGARSVQNPNSGLFPCRIQVTQVDGTVAAFNPSSSGTSCPTAGYEAPPWSQSSLTTYNTCPVAISGACWKVTYLLSGEVDYFDATSTKHQVVARADRSGNLQNFSYVSGRLQSVSGSGRSVSFSYPSAGSASCPTSTGSLAVASCTVATDPTGRTVTYVLTGSAATGYDVSAITLANATSSATWRFAYVNHFLVSWWTPQTVVNGAVGNEATTITYASTSVGSLNWVTEVEAPFVTGEGTSGTSAFRPTTTFSYVDQDLFSGNGTVVVSDPTTNENLVHGTALSGANVTLDRYVNFTLASEQQGYGPTASKLVNPTAIAASSATTLRDPFTLMPVETIGARAGTGFAGLYTFDVSLMSYDALGNVLSMWTPGPDAASWNETDYIYNPLNEVSASTDPLGNVSSASYDALGRVTSTTTPATNSWTPPAVTSNFYLATGQLCASRDANEVAAYGPLTSCSATHATLYSYNAAGDSTLTTDPLGHVSMRAYDANGNLCATLSPAAYSSGQRLSNCPTTPTPNVAATLSRNLYGSPTITATASNASGGSTFTFYNANNDPVAVVGPLGNPATCDPLTQSACPHTSYTTYNELGVVTSSAAPATKSSTPGPTTRSFIDPNGNTVATTDSSGGTTITIPTSLGTTQATAPADALVGSCSLRSLVALCPRASFSLSDAAGNVTTVAQPTASGSGVSVATTVYDPMGNVASSTDETGTTTTSVYDANGETLSTISTNATVTTGSTSAYNPSGTVCWSTPLVVSGTANCANPPLGSLNQTTLNYYDQDGRLVATTNPGTVAFSPATPTSCNPLTTTTCDGVTYYSFDEVGHNVENITPAGPSTARGVTTNAFDANGNLVAIVTPIGAGTGCNPTVTSTCLGASYSTYDAQNRLLSVSYTDGTPTVSYTYNADGTKATETDGTGTSTFHYDSAGRLLDTTNGAGAVTTWGYNDAGQLVCQSYDNNAGNTCASPLAGSSTPPTGLVTFTYDDQGRASSLITWNAVTLTTAYDCSGGKAWVSTATASVRSCDATHLALPAVPTDPSAITTTFTQNASGQMMNQATTTNHGSTNLLSFSFTYDELSRLKSSTPTVNAVTMATDRYGYDPTSRVTSGPITGTTGNPTYAYGPTGAITKATTHFTSAGYAPNGQLCWTSFATVAVPSCASPPPASSSPLTQAPTTFTYDQNGNRTSSTSPTTSSALTWQATSGRLICINTSGTTCSTSSPSATSTLYSYDGEGHRTTSANNGVTNTFTWDTSSSQLLADSTHNYLYLSGSASPDLQINLATGTVDLLIQDHNANTRGVVQVTGATSSLNGKLVNYTDYDAYGNPITESGGATNPGGMANGGVATDTSTSFAFGAGYSDSSNLTYLVHRYLDNETGQFISIDPLVDQTREAYVYAGDGPTMGIDPMGTDVEAWCLQVSVAILRVLGGGNGCIARIVGTTRTAFLASYAVGASSSKELRTIAKPSLSALSKIKSALTKGGSISLTYERTSCQNFTCEAGWFTYAGASLTLPFAVLPIGACGPTAGVIRGQFENRSIYGGFAGVQCSLTPQIGVTVSRSDTSVYTPSKNWARVINGTFNVLAVVGKAAIGAANLLKWLSEPW